MDNPIKLPEGSDFVAAQEFDEYRVELYVRPDGERHAVLRPKKFDADGVPIRAKMFQRFAELSVAHFGRPPERYSIEA